jgi:hypothetical protein
MNVNAVTQDNFLERQEPIERLDRVVFALSEACRQYGPAQEKTRAAMSAALTAECVGCGLRVTGDELLALAQLPSALETSSRIKWLRLGCCARNGCDSRAYVLKFQNHPGLNWAELFSKMETARPEEPAAPETEAESGPETSPAAGQRRALQIALAIAIGILLFLLHQKYRGGRIPFIREPEHFRVTPAGPGGEPR